MEKSPKGVAQIVQSVSLKQAYFVSEWAVQIESLIALCFEGHFGLIEGKSKIRKK